ncbi:uncharacterized protein LOC112081982 [Eutrema salsugineum]|uniref:uncharacterized protein LOC112081982 n=1 Tax=Eutrema salsugineum TaxID=72664 RepID=UPI000CED6828|nr:uncharacterized protein LOC112081982 [Eutrema salsugineum]
MEAPEQLTAETRVALDAGNGDNEIEEVVELERRTPEEGNNAEANDAEDNPEAVNAASPPMPKRKVVWPCDVPASSLSPTVIRSTLEACRLTDDAVFITPDAGDRPWDVPEDFLCIYLTYFMQCALTFLIPFRLLGYCNRRGVALTQMISTSVTNYTDFRSLCAELNENPTNRLFEDHFSVNLHASKDWYFAANTKPQKDIVTGIKPSRHLPSCLLNFGLTPEFQAAFSEAGKRRWPEAWDEILQRQAKKLASVKEPKPLKPESRAKKPRRPPRRKAPKLKKKRSTMLSLDEIPTLLDDDEPNDAMLNLVPTTKGDKQRVEEMALIANSPDPAGQKRLKKKTSSKKIKRIEGSSHPQETAAKLNPPVPTASELAIPWDQAEASNMRKGPSIDACDDLYHKISSEVPSLPKISKLRFPNLYKGIAHTTAVLASQTNTLIAGYEVALYDEQVRVAELEDRISKVDERLATELQINNELHNAVDLLKRECSDLKAVKAELTKA